MRFPAADAAGRGAMQPLDLRTKEEQVADFLREGIISGVFARGSRLKQAEIAERLQLSITPVREALKLLEAEGYVTGDSYRGACVAPFDASASEEVLELRLLLESRLIRGTAEKLSTQDITELRSLADEFEQAFNAGDRAGARGINYRFHRRMYSIADMPQTLHFVQILWARYPFDLINAVEGRGREAAKEHDAILRALLDGDASAAMLAMRKHIESGWSLLKPK
ncbi:MAG TPA: GntR family transcriptional regulator [Steroidobacteraceae bacterium]|nr:GntR family transcriptional regulator [Steroidobacteraceae bacterium]